MGGSGGRSRFLAQDPTQARSPDWPVQRTRPPPHAVERTGRDGRPRRVPHLAARHPLAVADDVAVVGILGDALGRLIRSRAHRASDARDIAASPYLTTT